MEFIVFLKPCALQKVYKYVVIDNGNRMLATHQNLNKNFDIEFSYDL